MEIKIKIMDFIKSEIVDGFMNINLDFTTDLIESGVIDSMGIMKLLVFVEESFNMKVSDSDLVPKNFESVDSISQLVEMTMTAN
jgi:acyl carrier protein